MFGAGAGYGGESMRFATTIAFCAAVLAAPGAAAQESPDNQPKETLSQFLARCDAGDADCHNGLVAGFEAAVDLGDVCPPGNLSEDQAADTELQWLRNAAGANQMLADGDEESAEFTALNTLWPCSN